MIVQISYHYICKVHGGRGGPFFCFSKWGGGGEWDCDCPVPHILNVSMLQIVHAS